MKKAMCAIESVLRGPVYGLVRLALIGTIGFAVQPAALADVDLVMTLPAPLDPTAAGNNLSNNLNVSLATDRQGNWVAVWDASRPGEQVPSLDRDILAARSTDAGATWTPPVALTSNDIGDDLFPSLATDRQGTWIAVWESQDSLGGTIGTDPDILVSRSVNNGASWTPPAALNTSAPFDVDADYQPVIATDGQGNWVVVWVSTYGPGTDYDLLVARSTNNGANWTVPAFLNTNADSDAGSDDRPAIATDDLGNWLVVWESMGALAPGDSEILGARSANNGATWTYPTLVNSNGDLGHYDGVPTIATDGGGNWVVIWSWDDPDDGASWTLRVARSVNNGAAWTTAALLNSNVAADGRGDGPPFLTTDRNGQWLVVWESYAAPGGNDDDIQVSLSLDNGTTWSNASTPSANPKLGPAADYRPAIATDEDGHWVVAWSSENRFCGQFGSQPEIWSAQLLELCVADAQCADGQTCTSDACNIGSGQCDHTPLATVALGDLDLSGIVDVDDILCMLNIFIGVFTCPVERADIAPCGGNCGIIDVDDILLMLAAFVGTPACPNPCP